MAGIDVRKYKLLAFIISSMMIGAAGVLRTMYNGHIGYEEFTLEMTVSYVAMIIVGGMASISGSILGAFLVIGLPYVVQYLATNTLPPDWSGFLWTNLSLLNITLYGIIVLAFLMFEPRGLAALVSRGYRRVMHRQKANPAASLGNKPS
jgi:branched-chain amino acid transport system permease protein